MRRIFYVLNLLLIAVLCFSSCSMENTAGDNVPQESEDVTGDINNININASSLEDKALSVNVLSDSTITIRNMDEDSYYSIYPMNRKSRDGYAEASSSKFIRTGLSTYLPIAGEDGTITFKASEIGIKDGSFRIIKLKSGGDRKIDIESDEPSFILPDGRKIWEEFYLINAEELIKNTSSITDPKRVVMINKSLGSGAISSTGGYHSDDFGVLFEKYGYIRSTVMDLTSPEYRVIPVYSSCAAYDGNHKNHSHEIVFTTPKELIADEPATINEDIAFYISADNKDPDAEYVLEFSRSGYSTNYRDASALYRDGTHRPYLTPIDKENKIIYVGRIGSDFFFNCMKVSSDDIAGTVMLRKASEEDKKLYMYLDYEITDSVDLQISPSQFNKRGIFTYVFSEKTADSVKNMTAEIKGLNSKNEDYIDFFSGAIGRKGYSNEVLEADGSFRVSRDRRLETMTIVSKEKDITLTLR